MKTMDELLAALRAVAEPTRLRLAVLSARGGELTVSELTQILGQSQPRVSRHLKLLCDAGLLQRFREGSWVFYRSTDRGPGNDFVRSITSIASADSEVFEGDRRRLTVVREARQAEAAAFFKANAADWERIRSLHAPEPEVEAAILEQIDKLPHRVVLDAGTGTGRMLELLAPAIQLGTGVDISPEMLAI